MESALNNQNSPLEKPTEMAETITTTSRFAALENWKVDLTPEIKEFFARKNVKDESKICELVAYDLKTISKDLEILFEADDQETLDRVLPAEINSLLKQEKVGTRVDHVGTETYGPIEPYMELLRLRAEEVGLKYEPYPEGSSNSLTPVGTILFPSTTVVKDLQQVEQEAKGRVDLKEVKIGRIRWSDPAKPERGIKCIEFFQVDGQPAFGNEAYTVQTRKANLESLDNKDMRERILRGEIPTVNPVDHLSVEVSRPEGVRLIHEALAPANDKSGKPKRYLEEMGFNAGDNSVNTKIIDPSTGQNQEIIYTAKNMMEFEQIKAATPDAFKAK